MVDYKMRPKTVSHTVDPHKGGWPTVCADLRDRCIEHHQDLWDSLDNVSFADYRLREHTFRQLYQKYHLTMSWW